MTFHVISDRQGGRPAPHDCGSHLSGFTMIELLVVMLLITIILSVTIPRFDTGILQDPQKQFTRWIVHTTRALRTAAIETQNVHTLVVDLDGNRMWIVNTAMEEEALAAAPDKAFKPGGTIRLVNVQFPDQDSMTPGTVEIHFHPAGFSDQAMIHYTINNSQRFTFQMEPLLPKVRWLEGWPSY